MNTDLILNELMTQDLIEQALMIEDVANRQRALELRSFIVEAPAGAGKTELLTQRYLKLLQQVNAPEEIIAITFTNKAAAEMRLRILDSLIAAAANNPPELPHKQITYDLSLQALAHAEKSKEPWQLIENPSRLRIFTIDSLCANLARQMPLLSRFGAQPKVADDAATLYTDAALQTLALLDHVEHGDIVKTALRYVDNNAAQLTSLLVSMLQKRDQWLHQAQHEIEPKQLQNTLRYLIEHELQLTTQLFNADLQQQLMPLARFAASHLQGSDSIIKLLMDWDTPLTTNAEALPMWLSVRELLLTKDNTIRAKLDKNIGFLPEYKGEKASFNAYLESLEAIPDFASSLAKLLTLPTFSATLDSWQMITALSQLLNLAVAQLWLVFQQAGEVDFVEIAQRAVLALGANTGEDIFVPTDLALKLDYQIKHLLVDEFQDTSPSQITLLEQLTLGWQTNDNRTLFCVGDPMQSIYRFRKANVGLFINAATRGIGDIKLERLQLYRNNRATPQIVSWINQTFAPLFAKYDIEDQGAVKYRPSFANPNKSNADSAVCVHAIINNNATDDAKQQEADAVIAIIKFERAANPDAKIAVLVSAKNHLTHLVSTLRKLHTDIPFKALDIEALKNRQVVQDLLSLTHALHHLADRVHWLAVLRAPWSGLSLHDLHALAGNNHFATIWQLMQNDAVLQTLSADGQTRLLHVRAIFADAFAAQGRMQTSRWVRSVWLMLNGAACLWEPNDVIDVQAFFSCLDNLDKRNQFSPQRMCIEIEKLFAAPDADGEHLQMMTIHKSKGLEFDTVILLGLGAAIGGNNADKPLLLWEEVVTNHQFGSHTELLAAPFVPKGARNQSVVSVYDFLARRECVRDTNEDARVLYVAATRAERKLHLVGYANHNKDNVIKPAANTPLALLWPAVSHYFDDIIKTNIIENTNNIEIAEDDFKHFTPQLVRLNHLKIPTVLGTTNANYQSRYKPAEKNLSPATLPNLAADLGTLAHLYMEIFANHGLSHWPASRIDACLQGMQFWLLQRGHAKQTIEKQLPFVINALKRTITSPQGAWILAARASLRTEFGISHADKDQRIDITFIEDDGLTKTRWIIDYKLGLDVTEASANALALTYQPQLAGYAALFAHEELPIKIAVLFLSLGKLIELSE